MLTYAIDIETFSVRPNAVVASIGLACSDGCTWYWRLEHDVRADGTRGGGPGQERRGVTPTALDFWSSDKVTPEAQREVFDRSLDRVPAKQALSEIRAILDARPYDNIWARGSMDQNVLDDLARELGMEPIAPYWVWRDERTLGDVAAILDIPTQKPGAHRADLDAQVCLRNVQRVLGDVWEVVLND